MLQKPARLAEILRAAGVESQLELLLLHRLERAGLPRPETQQQLIAGRKWRYDAVFRAERLAIEVQGGIWISGAHNRGSGVSRDCEKIAAAVALGYRVMPVTRAMIEDGTAISLIRQALGLDSLRVDVVK